MAESAAIIGDGAVLTYADDSAVATSPVTVGEVVSISPPSESIGPVETTHLGSDSNAKEFTAGLIDGGEVSVTINYVETMHSTLKTLFNARGKKYFKVLFSDASYVIFRGFLTSCTIGTVEAEEKMVTEFGIKVTALPVFTQA